MERRLLTAIGERVDQKAVGQLASASEKLEKAVESNQQTPSGQKRPG